ncbi:MAG: FAD-dependent oxidoreductase [Planctomycetes bacterium]|nr:FAD-dependent oxidoreductase [Planctomycetota bacterium]
MTATGGSATRIVLLGAGHAHHYALAHLEAYARSGCAVTLVAENPFWYSGMASGILGGDYAPEEAQIDVFALAARGGATVVAGRATFIDRPGRRVVLEDGKTVPYDLVSLAIGSGVRTDLTLPGPESAFTVKPLARLWDLRCVLERLVHERAQAPVTVVVIGGGASACEAAANAHALITARGGRAQIVLVTGETWLSVLPDHVRAQVARDFARRGIRVERARALGCTAHGVAVVGRPVITCDAVVIATGLKPPPLAAASGLPVDGEGALLVDANLRSLGDPRIFGGGDCIAIAGHDVPRLGVFAVRQGPVLHANLIAAARGTQLRIYRPQRRWLSILNLGDHRGLATWGPFNWHGRGAWLLKDRIDRAFIRRYRRTCLARWSS